MMPLVSIVVPNWNHPEAQRRNVIRGLLDTLPQTIAPAYELIVVDNGSPDPTTVPLLVDYYNRRIITTLVLLPENRYFCEGNNIGVRVSNPKSDYVLLLNSDIEILRPDWLLRIRDWLECAIPDTITHHYDIVSVGWTADPQVDPSIARPEGFCCMMRKGVFRELDGAFVHCNGLEEMLASAIRGGARCGVLGNWQRYLIHHSGASESWRNREAISEKTTRQPDYTTWFSGLAIDALDFSLDDATKDRIRSTPEWQFADDPSYATLKSW